MDVLLLCIVLFVVCIYIFYSVYSASPYSFGLDSGSFREGLETAESSASSSSNGIAGNAAAYGANIKTQSVKAQDALLISKYRADYETVIVNMDELVDNLMLKVALTIDSSKPQEALGKLVILNQSKAALNNVMKFIDKS